MISNYNCLIHYITRYLWIRALYQLRTNLLLSVSCSWCIDVSISCSMWYIDCYVTSETFYDAFWSGACIICVFKGIFTWIFFSIIRFCGYVELIVWSKILVLDCSLQWLDIYKLEFYLEQKQICYYRFIVFNVAIPLFAVASGALTVLWRH